MNESTFASVVKIVQELLAHEEDSTGITPALISEKIELVLKMHPKWGIGLDKSAVIDELIRRFSFWIGTDTALVSNVGHEAWLDASRKQDWRYWQRYRELQEKKLSWRAVDALDKSTDRILGMLEDPLRPGPWDRRGLVVGHVQSGKTANYTGLICKAADAQYKVIIVLAGLHNNLRSQTQIRLEEGFLGYETGSKGNVQPRTGVGEIDTDPSINPNCATTRTNSGDFGGRAARQLSISPEQRPWLFVVKKNKSVLVQLLKWIQNHVADTPITPSDLEEDQADPLPQVKKRVTKLPLLIVDDEADNASVDTGETILGSDGTPNEEHNPTTINRLIRRLLSSFSRAAYVGYTATPFANIFIHEKGATKADGPDLFPAAFIQNLAAPSSYVGPTTVFGRPTQNGRVAQLPLVKEVSDFASKDGTSGWMPAKHKSSHVPMFSPVDSLPPSLKEAIQSFLLACTVRSLRGQGAQHSSMLIHVTRFTQVQAEVHRQVSEYMQGVRQRISRRINHEMLFAEIKKLWEDDFCPTTKTVRAAGIGGIPEEDPGWDEIKDRLSAIVQDIDVRMINGTAKDVLDYEENSGKGLKVIAIGGDKLARGLTLEGLCTSYFLRASKMYDTLMQMGRWFGYRDGYLDLGRLYTSSDLVRWFKHVSDAAAELREEFDLMASSGATPRDYGLKVKLHPELLITSRMKMQSARTVKISFSGELMQTVSLPNDKRVNEKNLDSLRALIASLGAPERNPVRNRSNGIVQQWSGHYWAAVPHERVVDFLRSYRTNESAFRVNSEALAKFIDVMAKNGELTDWGVALIGVRTGKPLELSTGVSANMVKRSGDPQFEDRYAIGVLLDPKDESIDLSDKQWTAALALTKRIWEKAGRSGEPEVPSGPAVRQIRGLGDGDDVSPSPQRGVLILYVLDPAEAGLNLDPEMPGIVAFGISFPGSKSNESIEYKVNNVAWELEYGPAD